MLIELLNAKEKWSWYVLRREKEKLLGYEQAVVYDRVLRFEERDKLMKILYYVYLLDVYGAAVANVAKERDFVLRKPHPDKNTLVMSVFHPFLTNPVGNNDHGGRE